MPLYNNINHHFFSGFPQCDLSLLYKYTCPSPMAYFFAIHISDVDTPPLTQFCVICVNPSHLVMLQNTVSVRLAMCARASPFSQPQKEK